MIRRRRWQPGWSPGRSRISRKAVAQGRPDDPPVPVVLPRAFCCTRIMGAVGTRPSLRPLFFGGTILMQASDALRRENAEVCVAGRLPQFVVASTLFENRIRNCCA